jgi:hypothetical protein
MKRPPAVRAASLSAVKKHVLMIVTRSPKNNLRVNVLRKHGLEVVCANHIGEARMLWHPDTYDLVLFDLRHENGAAVELCHDIKTERPGQLVAFFVGKPDGGFLEATWKMSLALAVKPAAQRPTEPTLPAVEVTALPDVAVSFSFGDAVRQAAAGEQEMN